MKYKVGDKVKIRSDLEPGKNYKMEDGGYHVFVTGMSGKRGTIQTISGAIKSGYQLEGDVFSWTDEMFEGKVEEKPNWKLVIIPDGDATKGLYYENGKVSKIVEVKRYFKDEYDANAAIKAICEKLTEKPRKFKVGDIVVARKDNGYSITTDGWKGRVVAIHEDSMIDVRGNGLSDECTFLVREDAFDLADEKTIKEEPKFKSGDLVEVTEEYMGCPKGLRGRIVRAWKHDNKTYLVDFCVKYSFTHTGNGDTPEGTGYFISEKNLRKVD